MEFSDNSNMLHIDLTSLLLEIKNMFHSVQFFNHHLIELWVKKVQDILRISSSRPTDSLKTIKLSARSLAIEREISRDDGRSMQNSRLFGKRARDSLLQPRTLTQHRIGSRVALDRSLGNLELHALYVYSKGRSPLSR